jgi:hypothetical protein
MVEAKLLPGPHQFSYAEDLATAIRVLLNAKANQGVLRHRKKNLSLYIQLPSAKVTNNKNLRTLATS